jgi:hypothetical protein
LTPISLARILGFETLAMQTFLKYIRRKLAIVCGLQKSLAIGRRGSQGMALGALTDGSL